MKKVFSLICVSLVCLTIWASKEFSASFDCMFLQDFARNKSAIQLNADTRFTFDTNYQIRVPLTVSIKQTGYFVDTGIYAVCYPYKGLFFGVSVFETGFTLKNANSTKKTMVLNEIMAGWKFDIKNGWFVEPTLVIKDPTGTYSNEYAQLKGLFPCYRTYRLRVSVGKSFNIGGKSHEN